MADRLQPPPTCSSVPAGWPLAGAEAVMKPDVLSDVLRAVRLTGAIYFDFELCSPWVMKAAPSRDLVRRLMPGAQQVVEYHLIVRGACCVHAVGHPPIRLREGDLVVFPRGDAHVLSSAPGMRAAPDASAFVRPSPQLPLVYEVESGGPERARILCCFQGCDDRPYNPLFGALPAIIHIPAAGPHPACGWLGTLLRIAAGESGSARPGGENVLARLSELMLVETLRYYVETLPAAPASWLDGLREPVVGQALAALHGEPREPWTVERLARLVGLSRSVFAERFTHLVGRPPMQYLALWRMQLAARLLAEGGRVASVADAVGYESEAAFSRAFKKLVGQAPAMWRRGAGSQVPPVQHV
jgi:AraC-like DNA-binding protein